MHYSQQIAQALLHIKAVGFNLKDPIQFKSGAFSPIRFKSGILSPVYVDNRIFPSHVKQWRLVIEGFKQLIKDKNLKFDMIAGIEAAGIPHSAALGYSLQKPSLFVRKEKKTHGTKKRVEGGNVKNKKVLLIEDHVSTGTSSLRGVNLLRDEGAVVSDCFAITSYGFVDADKAFVKNKVNLHTLTTFDVVLKEALAQKLITASQLKNISSWLKDPQAWTKNNE